MTKEIVDAPSFRVKSTRKRLAKLFPDCIAYKGERKPFKIGIDADIFRAAPELYRLHRYVGHFFEEYTADPLYLSAMIEGATRVDIHGSPAGVVTAQDALAAARRLKKILAREAAAQKSKPPKPVTPPPAPPVAVVAPARVPVVVIKRPKLTLFRKTA